MRGAVLQTKKVGFMKKLGMLAGLLSMTGTFVLFIPPSQAQIVAETRPSEYTQGPQVDLYRVASSAARRQQFAALKVMMDDGSLKKVLLLDQKVIGVAWQIAQKIYSTGILHSQSSTSEKKPTGTADLG